MNRVTTAFIGFILACLLNSAPLEGQTVEVVRDNYWVPHIIGDTPRECAYGLGRAMSEDHPRSVVDNILSVRGEMAAAYGIRFLNDDLKSRAARILDTATQHHATLPDDAAGYLDGFALGVNDHFSEHPEDLPAELQGMEMWPVLGVEVFALYNVKALMQQFSEFTRDAGDLLDGTMTKPVPVIPEARQSNQWAIAPSRTRDGATYLLGDPHTPFGDIFTSYEAHLISRDGKLDFEGQFFAGVPLVGNGHNRHVAFSGTSNTPDFADAYAVTLDPEDPDAYLVDGESRPFQIWQETFEVAGASDTTVTFKTSPDHGVVVKRLVNGQVLMAKLEMLNSPPAGLQIYREMTARSVDDLRAALGLHQFDKGNSVAGDADGNIYYVYNAISHFRNDPVAARGSVLDGSSSTSIWLGLIPFVQLPQVYNPTSGYVQNCNDAPWYATEDPGFGPGDVPLEVFSGDHLGVRGRRAVELISLGADTIDLDYCKKMALDKKIIAWDSVRSVLAEALQESANNGHPRQDEAEALAAMLFAWDGMATKESEAMSLFTEWFLLLESDVNFLNPASIGEDTRQLMVDELVAAGDLMLSRFGATHAPWGQIHGFERGGNWYPVSGGGKGHIGAARMGVWAQRDGQHRFMVKGGNNFMMVIRLKNGEPPQAWTMKPYGQSSDPSSPHYADLTALYSADSLRKTYYEEEEFRARAERIDVYTVTSVGHAPREEWPDAPALEAWPNPVSETASIKFALQREGEVRLAVHNILGQEVHVMEFGDLEPGSHRVTWETPRPLPSGTYFMRLVVNHRQVSATRLAVIR